MTADELLRAIEDQRDLMIAVSTGGPRIDDVNPEYRQRRDEIARGLRERGLGDPNPYSDLWRWYAYWSTHLGTYASRRAYIAELYEPLIDQVRSGPMPAQAFDEPTGWDRVDRGVGRARRELQVAETEEQFQAIGLHCREVLISLGSIVFDPEEHETFDGVAPSETDARRRLEGFINAALPGSGNDEARAFAKKAVAFAAALQHKRTATFQDAALCVEATNSVVNIVAVLAGQRDADRERENHH